MNAKKLFLVLVLALMLVFPTVTTLAQDGSGETDPFEVYVEIEGEVEIVQPDLIVIDGYTVAPGGVFRPADLEVGDWVLIGGYLLPDDVLRALTFEIILDWDDDGVVDLEDNCPFVANPTQTDTDDDGVGDDCADDYDADTVLDEADNCPMLPNGDQLDADADGLGDVCDTDTQDTDCLSTEQPVAEALAVEFEDYTYEQIMAWYCDGFGFGEIARALLLEESVDGVVTAEEFLAMAADGLGWGEIIQAAGLEPSDFSDLSVVLAARNRERTREADEGEDMTAPLGQNGQGNNENPGGPNGEMEQNGNQNPGGPNGETEQNSNQNSNGPNGENPPAQNGNGPQTQQHGH